MQNGSSSIVDVAAAEAVDEHALVCRYCGCTRDGPCILDATSRPLYKYDPCDPRLNALRRNAYPCGWQRIVELLDGAGEHAGYFAVCTNADCVRAHLADAHAP